MVFYWGLWAFILILSFKWKENSYFQSYKFFSFIILILALLTGGRENVGTDWSNYRVYYETGIAYDKSSGHMEFLFELIRNICFSLGFSYGMFCFIITLISLFTLRKAFVLMGINNCFIAFLVYLSLFFCNYQFNIIRHGMLASFMLLSMAYLARGDKFKSSVCVGVSCGFHMMGLIFIPLLFLFKKTLSRKCFLIIIGISVVVFIADMSGRIMAAFPFLAMIDRISGYVDTDLNDSYKLSIGTIGFLAISIYAIFFRRVDYESNSIFRITANMVMMGFVVFCVFNAFSAIVQRVGNLLNLGVVFLLPYIWEIIAKCQVKYIVRYLIIIYLALYYPKSWNVPNEEGDYSMLPFKTDITNLF